MSGMIKVDERVVYKPLEWQYAPLLDKSPVLLLTGAAGGGKSRLAAEKIHAYLMQYPGATGLMGRKDRATATKSIVPFMNHTVMGDTSWGVYRSSDNVFNYANGSQLWVIGMRDDGQRESLRSIGKDGSVDIAWLEELNAFSRRDFDEVRARLRGTAAGWRQIIGTTNPDAPSHWIKKDLIDGGVAKVYYSRPEDNPYNPPEYIDTLKSLTGILYDRLYRGLWVQAEGAVYDEYDVSVHQIDTFDPPVYGRFIVSIDFGYTNPFSASLWYIDDEDRMYLYRQIYHTRRTVEEHVPAIKKMTEGYKIEAWICDTDAEDRATLENHMDISTKTAMKSVITGIQAVKTRLAKKEIFFMRGALVETDQALANVRRPLCTIDEISGYTWSDKKQDTPIKTDDHGVDEMRYAVMYLDGGSRPKGTISIEVGNYAMGKKDDDIDG